MDEGTLRLSNLKADVGAELWLMQSSLEEVRRQYMSRTTIRGWKGGENVSSDCVGNV